MVSNSAINSVFGTCYSNHCIVSPVGNESFWWTSVLLRINSVFQMLYWNLYVIAFVTWHCCVNVF